MVLRFKKLDPNTLTPKKAHQMDAGWDLFSMSDVDLLPFTPTKISTKIAVDIPAGYVGLIQDRSSMGLKGIKVLGGVIDAGYRGEIGVILINLTQNPILLKAQSKIAQLLILPIANPTIIDVLSEVEDFSDSTERNTNGFGSTGV